VCPFSLNFSTKVIFKARTVCAPQCKKKKTFSLPKSIANMLKRMAKVCKCNPDAQVIIEDSKHKIDAHVCGNRQVTADELNEVFRYYERVTVQGRYRETCARPETEQKDRLNELAADLSDDGE
jgi:hypothetical protein